jgi:hypothetical protein
MWHPMQLTAAAPIAVGVKVKPRAELLRRRKWQCKPKTRCVSRAKNLAFQDILHSAGITVYSGRYSQNLPPQKFKAGDRRFERCISLCSYGAPINRMFWITPSV